MIRHVRRVFTSPRRTARLVVILSLAAISGACSSGGEGSREGSPPVDVDPKLAALLDELSGETERDPESAGAWAELGLAYDANGFPRSALGAFERAAALQPAEPRWAYHCACALARLGELDRALESIDDVLRLAPSYAPAHWRRGKWLLDLGRLDEAERSFRECARLEPEGVVAPRELARIHLQRGEASEAVGILERIAPRAGGDSHVHHLLARAYRISGDLERARSELAKAGEPKEIDRSDPWRDERRPYRVGFAAELEKGIALLQEGRFEPGIVVLEGIRSEQPGNVTLLANLGAAYCATQRYAQGVSTLEAVLKLRPGHFPALYSLIEALEVTNQTKSALAWAEKAVETNPNLGAAHRKKAEVLMRLGRSAEAVESFDRARRLGERRVTSLTASGRLKIRLQRWSGAADDFRAALELDPALASARLGLARALAESGELAAARRELDEAAAALSASPALDQVRARIDEIERGGGL